MLTSIERINDFLIENKFEGISKFQNLIWEMESKIQSGPFNRFNHITLIFDHKKSLLTYGVNHIKINRNGIYSIHSEIDALNKLKRYSTTKSSNKKVHLINFRFTKFFINNSKPCENCSQRILQKRKYISTVQYSLSNELFELERC